jgi:predicted dehydrogenase
MSVRTSRRFSWVLLPPLPRGAWRADRLLGQSVPVGSSPNDKINVAFIGVGGKGTENLGRLSEMKSVNVVALCDVDARTRGKAAEKHPKAKQYDDYRKLLDDQKDFDAAVVTIPDNHHAFAAVNAMRLGKHVYCEKPLTHDIAEARLMRETAAQHKSLRRWATPATPAARCARWSRRCRRASFGTSPRPTRGATAHLAAGHPRPAGADPVPSYLNWDMWLGPAPERPYKGPRVYHDFVWRGWWDFGTGALGDMGCHIIDSIFWGCELTSPTAIEADFDSPHNDETAPIWSEVRFTFAGKNGKPIKVTWHDGGKLPPAELHDGIIKKNEKGQVNIDNGVLIVGDKGGC